MVLVQIIQLIISIILMVLILLQQKGAGLGTAWGGQGSFYHTKRGVEKVLFIFTIILVVAFFAVSILNFSLA